MLRLKPKNKQPQPTPEAIPVFLPDLPTDVVAVFFNPITGKAAWQINPLPGYEQHGWKEFTQFKGEFPFYPVDPVKAEKDGDTEGESLRQAIKEAKALYWSLIAPPKPTA